MDKVNYCMLDAKNIFLDMVLKQLELIEGGRVIQSDLVVPSIFRFLFLLSRLKDKKLITVPKIINLCDNLLANRNIVSSGTLGLIELAFEFFFRTKEASSVSDGASVTAEEMLALKDVSTQKEVAFSMLIKFLDAVEVQRMLGAILMLHKHRQEPDNENEVLVNVVQLVAERKISLDTPRSYDSVCIIFEILEPSVIRGSVLEKIISIWQKSVFANEVLSDCHLK